MRVLLVNPPYVSLTSAYGVGHQVPLGLLCLGGPLIDAGHDVFLLDAEQQHLTGEALEKAIEGFCPDIVMAGHAGSTPAHLASLATFKAAKKQCPSAITIYGGVYPTYHARDILASVPEIDIIVRGEGEAIALALVSALASQQSLEDIKGISWRAANGDLIETADAPSIVSLDEWRVGWELIKNWDLYQCFGIGRATVIQFSRGCPHRCSYCGQYAFWNRWRYRTPQKIAEEIAWLYHTHNIRFFDLADENPTSSKRLWREFLEAVVAQNIPVRLFATIRAADIARDADLLPLMKKAGMVCVLMGIETTDPDTLKEIRKGSTVKEDQMAIKLLREHGILSMLGHIVGFEEERKSHYWQALRQIVTYDPDLLNAMYVTPHRWSDWTAENGDRIVIQDNLSFWDYRHQLLSTRYLSPASVFWMVKLMEIVVHLRPKSVWRILVHPDQEIRAYLRWCFRNSARVWFAEVAEFLWKTPRPHKPRTLRAFFGKQEEKQSIVVFSQRTSAGKQVHDHHTV